MPILLALLGIYIGSRPKAEYKIPPGPRGLPILGNALQLPPQHLGSYFRFLLETYGGLVSLNLAGTPTILIGDMGVAKELLEKRAAKFSARPKLFYFEYYVDPSQSYWAFHDPNEIVSIGRKMVTAIMSSVRAGQTEPLQQFESLLTLQHLLDDGGKNWSRHLYRVSASTTLTAMFGIHCPTGDEPEQKEIMSAAQEFVTLCTPNASIVNILPLLDWIPGPMPWRTRAGAFRKRDSELYKRLVHEAISGKGSNMKTWVADFARDKSEGDLSRFMNGLVVASIETIAVTLHTFILGCIMYPEWIQKAQQQIDDIIGPDRLPSFADRSRLPYVEAAVRETLRWRPAVRFGVPHRSIADDVVEYKGERYFIPTGTTIIAVTWAIEHETSRYANPDSFDPSRFLNDGGQLRSDYETSAFGFGRRMCPGIPMAERTLFIEIAMLLWTFHIRKSQEPYTKTGIPFQYNDTDAAFTGDITSAPHDFPVVFEPRSARHVEVARQEWEACEKNLNVLLPNAQE